MTRRDASWLLAALVPAGILAVLIQHYAVDVPYWDDWDLVVFLDRWHSGELSLADLFEQHNEHRPAFPRMLMLALAGATGWNVVYEMGLSLLLALTTFVALLVLASRTQASVGRPGIRGSACLISLFVFSLGQSENWLWGWQLQLLLNLVAVVIGIGLLSMPLFGWARFTGAAALGVVATFSFGNGPLYWVVALPIIALSGEWARRSKQLAATAWIAVAAATTLIYLSGYRSPMRHPSLATALEQPLDYARYVLAFLGNAASRTHPLAFGALGLGLLVVSVTLLLRLHRLRLDRLMPWLALSLYAIGSAMAIGIGRVGMGRDQALVSRYVTFANLLWVSLAVLFYLLFSASLDSLKKGGRTAAAGGLSLSAIALAAVVWPLYGNTRADLDAFATRHDQLVPARAALAALENPEGMLVHVRREGRDQLMAIDDALPRLFPKADEVRARARILLRHRLSVFRPGDETAREAAATSEKISARVVQAEPIVRDLQQTLRVNPEHPHALGDLAQLLTAVGRHEEAAGYHVEIARRNPTDLDARFGLGRALLYADRAQDAVEVLAELVRVEPRHDEARSILGRALLELGRAGEAVDQLELLVRQDPTHADAHYRLGLALLRLGRRDEARVHLERAVDLDAHLFAAHLELGEIHLQLNEVDRAEAYFGEVRRMKPFLAEADLRE